MDVGFIGLGNMGSNMARSFLQAGHRLVVHDTRREAASPLLAEGAAWAGTPEEVARQCRVVFTSLPGPAEMEATVLGPQGLLAGMQSGGVYFDLTTNSVSTVRRVHEAFGQRGMHMLDAPVSGGPAGAAARKLALWVSGDESIFREYKPLLEALGDQILFIGGIGAATVAKLVHNCVGYVINTGLAEVFAMGVKAGAEPLALWKAIRQGAVGRNRTFDLVAETFLASRYDPAKFALRLAHKDVALATALGRELGVPMRLANLTLEEMTEAMGRGWGDRDSRSAMLLQLQRAGVEFAIDPAEIRAELAADASRDAARPKKEGST